MTDDELAKDLGLLSALTIGIGTMIGAGIFILPGVASREAGPLVIASFLIGGTIAMINAFAVAELGTAMPKAGGAYYWINRALGPLFGTVSGMGDWMGLAFASAFYCIGFGGYLSVLLEDAVVSLPAVGTLSLALPTVDLFLFTLTDVQIGALIAAAIFVGVNYIGAKETGGVQTVIVTLLLGILTLFAVAGFLSFDYSTLFADGVSPQGYGAILPGTALVFVAFLGYAKIGTVAEEMKNPGRNLPIAVIGSVATVMVIYAVLVAIMIGVVPWDELSKDTPVSQVAEIVFVGPLGVAGLGLITFAALLATASSANASILASARINFAMGRDKLVTDWLNEIHPRFTTPYRSIAVTGTVIFLFVAWGSVESLAKAASVLHLVVYALMNVALITFRESGVEYDPDFRVPLYPVTPILGAVLSLGLIYFMAPIEQQLGFLFVAGAVVWYFVYARRNTEKEGILTEYIMGRSDELPDAAVSAAEAVAPEDYRVMVPVSNPRTERDLVRLGGAVAKAKNGKLVAVHVVTVPDQTSLRRAAESDAFTGDEAVIESAREHAEEMGVPVETHTVFSHRALEEVFDAAREYDADIAVMGWGDEGRLSAGRAESLVDELAHDLPCDFLVYEERSGDSSRVLFPTDGGPHGELGAEVALALRDAVGSEIRLLHVADDREEGEEFLDEWANANGLGDAEFVVRTGDVEKVIEEEAEEASLLLMGAVSEGLLSRLVGGSLVYDVVYDVDTSVIIAEKARHRSILERLFG
ncbi:MAG: amino acid permease [Halobacteriales archaeon]